MRLKLDFANLVDGQPVSLPFQVLLIGDFIGAPDARVVEDRKDIRVQQDDIAAARKRGEADHARALNRSASSSGPAVGVVTDAAAAERTRAERLWEALRQLVESIPHGAPVNVSWLNVSREDLLFDFEDSPDFTKSGLAKHLHGSGFGNYACRPYGLVLGLWDIVGSVEDAYLASQCALAAKASHVPMLLSCGGEFGATAAGAPTLQALLSRDEGRYVAFMPSSAMPTIWQLTSRMVASFASYGHAGACDVQRLANEQLFAGREGKQASAQRLATTAIAAEFARYLKMVVNQHHRDWNDVSTVEANLRVWLNRWVGPAETGQPLRAASLDVTQPTSYGPLNFQLTLSGHDNQLPRDTVIEGFIENLFS